MVMEAMACNLTSFVNTNQNISINTKFSIIADVAFGLYYLHSQNPPIVHCDLSPNSILMTSQGVATISDFGVYKIMRAGGRCTILQCNPDFMPPEAGNGAGPDSHSSVDVFAFAGIVLFILTQQWPKPSDPFEVDPKASNMVPLSEVQRRMKYLDLLTEESAVLKPLIEECLDMDPAIRLSMVDIHEEIISIEITLSKNIVQQPKHEEEQEENHPVSCLNYKTLDF